MIVSRFWAHESKHVNYCGPNNTETTRIPSRAAPKNSPQNSEHPRLLDQVRAKLRVAHYSIQTESVYVDWKRNSDRQQGLILRICGNERPVMTDGTGRQRVPADGFRCSTSREDYFAFTIGFVRVPIPVISILTESPSSNVKLSGGTTPVPVSRNAPVTSSFSLISQPISSSNPRFI